MPHSIEKLAEGPIVFMRHEGALNVQEIDEIRETLMPMLDGATTPVFLIVDIRKMTMALDEMTLSATLVSRGSTAPLHHKNIRETLIVSTAPLVKLGAQGMRTATFGNVKLRVFETPEQAIQYCHEQIEIADNQSAEGSR